MRWRTMDEVKTGKGEAHMCKYFVYPDRGSRGNGSRLWIRRRREAQERPCEVRSLREMCKEDEEGTRKCQIEKTIKKSR